MSKSDNKTLSGKVKTITKESKSKSQISTQSLNANEEEWDIVEAPEMGKYHNIYAPPSKSNKKIKIEASHTIYFPNAKDQIKKK